MVERVAARPMWVVSMASAANRVRGSNRTRKLGWDFSLIYSPSPTNAKSSPSRMMNVTSSGPPGGPLHEPLDVTPQQQTRLHAFDLRHDCLERALRDLLIEADCDLTETGALTKPFVFRMTGNMVEEGVKILHEEREKRPELFEKVEFHGIETPIEHVAQRAVELAKAG